MKYHNFKKQIQKGFTMIELVIVIAVLGILAVFSLPRFADFSSDAKTARANSVAAALNSAMGIAKARYLAGGASVLPTYNSVRLNDKSILVDNNGDLAMNAIVVNSAGVSLCPVMIANLLSSKDNFIVEPNTDRTACLIKGDGYIITVTATQAIVNS